MSEGPEGGEPGGERRKAEIAIAKLIDRIAGLARDALADGLVSVESGKSMRNARILLTESGRALLQATAEQVQ